MDLEVAVDIDRLVATLAAAGRAVDDLTATNTDAGQLVIGATDPPRLTGSLDASQAVDATALGTTIRAGGRTRGGYRQQRTPAFLGDALDDQTPQVVDLYADLLTQALDLIGT
jgi:hypothetical protein